MKVLALNTFDADGGAARAAVRLSQSLRQEAVDIRLRVLRKTTDLDWVEAQTGLVGKLQALTRPVLDTLPLRRYPARAALPWSVNWLPAKSVDAAVAEVDLVHLHWVGFGFLAPAQLKRWHRPVVWTLHDMWPVTGGCHYSNDCQGFRSQCGQCPQLGSSNQQDLSARQHAAKADAMRHAAVTFVSPSRWMAEQARASGVLAGNAVHVIANGLDVDRFQPLDQAMARQAFGLPADRKIILFGAINAFGDERKGAALMLSAIRRLHEQGWAESTPPLYVVFGASALTDAAWSDLPIHCVGRLHDDVALALLYSAADVMVVPSLYETFGQTASEAMACGTPVVAFAATGLLDVVVHGETGYLAQPYEAEDLAQGIRWVLAEPERHQRLARAARQRSEECFDQRVVARQHKELYQSLLDQSVAAAANPEAGQ